MNPEAVRDLGYARVDLDRLRRCGRPEVVFCQGKLPEEVCGIAVTLRQNNQLVLATRAEIAHFQAIQNRLPDAVFHERARCITVGAAAIRADFWKVGVVVRERQTCRLPRRRLSLSKFRLARRADR